MARKSRSRAPHPSSKLEFAEIRRRLRRSGAGRLFGFELISIGKDRAVLSMLIHARHKQIHGVVHGGVVAAIADTAGAMAVYPMLPRGARLSTIEMKINYLEPLDRGRLSAEARVLRLGQNTAVVECEVHDPDGNLAAKALMTFAVMRRQRGGDSDRA